MTEREKLEKQMDYAARLFAETGKEKFNLDVERLSSKLADLGNLEVLEDVVARCRGEDMRNGDVYLTLEELGKRAAISWPIDIFREALEIENEEGRWQICMPLSMQFEERWDCEQSSAYPRLTSRCLEI
jgi:hypothetical protein